MLARGSPMDGAFKLLTLAARIAVVWTLLSLLITAFWWLLLEFGRRFGSRPASRRPAHEERRVSADARAIYADCPDYEGASGEAIAQSDQHEIGESDAIVFIWRSSVLRR